MRPFSMSTQEAARVLGVPPGAPAAELRAAYLRAVKEHPPDRSPVEFERIRDARARLESASSEQPASKLEVDPREPLTSLLGEAEANRRFLGPEPWLALLRSRR